MEEAIDKPAAESVASSYAVFYLKIGELARCMKHAVVGT